MKKKDCIPHLINVLTSPNAWFISNDSILSRDNWSLLLASCPVFIPSVEAGHRRALHTAVTDPHQRQTTDMGT